jgi:hypothetical protein
MATDWVMTPPPPGKSEERKQTQPLAALKVLTVKPIQMVLI